MNRFALLYNQMPWGRMKRIPFLVDNFDLIPSVIKDLDCDVLNEYEAIYIYMTSGANPSWYIGYTEWSDIPIWLNKNGVNKPKILYQLDYYGNNIENFNYPQVLPYIDCIMDPLIWKYKLNVPQYYVPFPMNIAEDIIVWKEYDDKELGAVGLKRHYGQPTPMMDLCCTLGIHLDILGLRGCHKRYGRDYCDFVASHKIGLDYHTSGLTWSRFAAEAAYCGTPVIGPPDYAAIKIANPDLALEYNDPELRPTIRRLITDKDYYIKCQFRAKKNIEKDTDPIVCGERYINILRELGIEI